MGSDRGLVTGQQLVRSGWRREVWAAQVPMPGVASQSGARIFEWLELKARRRDTDCGTVAYETFAVSRDQVRHWPPLPQVPMQPEATVHGVDHSLAP
jgi:hypothetical protein